MEQAELDKALAEIGIDVTPPFWQPAPGSISSGSQSAEVAVTPRDAQPASEQEQAVASTAPSRGAARPSPESPHPGPKRLLARSHSQTRAIIRVGC